MGKLAEKGRKGALCEKYGGAKFLFSSGRIGPGPMDRLDRWTVWPARPWLEDHVIFSLKCESWIIL